LQDETDIWERFRQGDRSALSELFCAHYETLDRYGRKLLRDEALRQDLVHDIFLEIWERKAPPPVVSVRAYLLGALRHRILAHFRETKRRSVPLPAEPDFCLSPEDFWVGREEEASALSRLLEAMDRIPPRQREILYLRYYCRLGYDEVCSLLGIGYQVARNQLSLGLSNLRKALKADR